MTEATCTSCGTQQPYERFCAACGAQLPPRPTTGAPYLKWHEARLCPAGHRAHIEDQFCRRCGGRVDPWERARFTPKAWTGIAIWGRSSDTSRFKERWTRPNGTLIHSRQSSVGPCSHWAFPFSCCGYSVAGGGRADLPGTRSARRWRPSTADSAVDGRPPVGSGRAATGPPVSKSTDEICCHGRSGPERGWCRGVERRWHCLRLPTERGLLAQQFPAPTG